MSTYITARKSNMLMRWW